MVTSDAARHTIIYERLRFVQTQPLAFIISFTIAQRLPLMRLAQKVYNGLDRIKGNKRHLYELGIPVAHCAVP